MTQGPLPSPRQSLPNSAPARGAPDRCRLEAHLRQMWVTLRRSSVVADGAMLSTFVHKLEARPTEEGAAGRAGQEIAAIPTIAWNRQSYL